MDIINRNAERLNREALDMLSHKFPTIEEIKAEAARKGAERAAAIKATGKDPIMELRDSFKHAPFAGIDGVAYQREMRDEWPE
jgi:hypothetical protein